MEMVAFKNKTFRKYNFYLLSTIYSYTSNSLNILHYNEIPVNTLNMTPTWWSFNNFKLWNNNIYSILY